jgi:hypothetical protein
MNKIPVNELKLLAARGGGMILDCNTIRASDLNLIAARASESKAQIILRNPSILSVADMKLIAARGNGCVVFDFYSE